MAKEIEIAVSQKGDASVISIKGDVTAMSGEEIENAYQKISSDGGKKILLNFDKDCYINSGGIAILIGMAAESKQKEQKIRITGLSAHFEKIFDMVGLTKYTEIFPSEDTALEGF